MPELPDITVYLEALESRILGSPLERVRVASPFVLRTADPPLEEVAGRRVRRLHRAGKRIVWEMDGSLFVVIHLMIAGRLYWREAGAPLHRKLGLAAFDFPAGTLLLTEASTKRRAAVHLVTSRAAVDSLDRGGLDVLAAGLDAFREAIRRENHTLKRTLTDPRILSGIGNAYSDEILHHARLSPITLSRRLGDEEIARLHASARAVLRTWIERLRAEANGAFPEKVTAFHAAMAVHGRFGQPCPDCSAPVQRIQYAENETNYCARCQTGGKVLADRSLSRLLKGDWPRSIEDLED